MSWNFLEPASRGNLDMVWRREADGLLDLVSDPALWDSPTAAGHWRVREVVAHLIHNTEAYLHSFHLTTVDEEPGLLLSVRDMAKNMDAGAQALSGLPRQELIDRLHGVLNSMLAVTAELSDKEWTDLLVPHWYMGPVPASFFPICQALEYIVHGWDVRKAVPGIRPLDGEAADLLVPLCFLMWPNTSDLDGVKEPFEIGVRVLSGANAGDTVGKVRPEGIEFVPGELSGLATVIEFDPAGLVLTAFGRADAGTVRGSRDLAEKFLNLFFRF